MNFLLLSDPDALLAKAYGAYGKRKFYGVPYEGTIRSTFVIGPDGKLVSAEYDVRPQESPEDALRCVCEG